MTTEYGKLFKTQSGLLVSVTEIDHEQARPFAELFADVPLDRTGMGFIEIGNFDEANDEYKFEGDVPLMVAPDGSVWARVCDSPADLPMSEDVEMKAEVILDEAEEAFKARTMARERAACGNWPAPRTISDYILHSGHLFIAG